MRLDDATAMLAGSNVSALGPTLWADLGCGRGTFTLALADALAPDSVIHAMDRDSAALRALPAGHADVRIATHCGDFTSQPWPFADLDGVLLANALHFVGDQAGFVRRCAAQMRPRHRFLIVEYDTDTANRWVPHPVSRSRLATLFNAAGYSSVRTLSARPSLYHRAAIYAALIEP